MQKYNLKEYSGNPIDFPEFISNYYLTLAAYEVADAEKIRKLVLCLKCSAREQYMELVNQAPPPPAAAGAQPAPLFSNWAAFKVAFERRIFPEGTQRIFRKAFYERTQRPGESIQEFTSALNTVAERAFGPQLSWPDNIRAIVKDQWWTNINPLIQQGLLIFADEPLADLVTKARKLEVHLPVSTVVHAVALERQPRAEPTCYQCQQVGHIAAQCPQRTNTKPNKGYQGKGQRQATSPNQAQGNNNQVAYRNAPPNNVAANDVQCTKCARKGHLAQTCRAYNLQCEVCQKMGHVKQVCRGGNQRNAAAQQVPPQYPQQIQPAQQQQYQQPVHQQQQYAPIAQQKYPSQAQQPPQQQQFAQPVVQRQQVNVDGKTRCYQCGQYGHMQRSCPTLNRVNCAEEQYDPPYNPQYNPQDDAYGNPAEQLQASLRQQYQEYDRQNCINVAGNHDGVEYEECIPPMRDYPRPEEPRKGKAYLTKMLQKWDWTQTDTHDEAIAVLQNERMQDDQQLIHHSLTQLGANWGRALPMYPVRFRTTDGKMKIITMGADDSSI